VSKNVAMFVDVANMYYAARGQDVDVDYVALLKHASKGRDLIRAYAYTGLDPENENQRKFIDFLAKNGYKPVVKDIRKFGDGRMKANLDIELVVDLFRLADRMDIAVIVSGDGDFAPAIRALQDKGVRCEVISFKPNTSSDLMAVADEFMDIMKVASISRKEARAATRAAGMSAPEMPAKEVTPEFGFREASPSVAAAALAALKGGPGDAGRRGRTGTTSRRAAAAAVPVASAQSPAAEPAGERVAAVGAEATDADPEARRRRRRRGGRGRGRTRRDEEEAGAPAATGGEEIGWEEFDDLSQIDGVPTEEREYTFEEADADTLAELGLSADDVASIESAAPPAAGDGEGPKPRRRSTRAKQAETPEAGPATEAGEASRPRRRTTRAKQAETPEAAPATETGEAPKPRRRSTRAKQEETPAAPTTGDDQAPRPRRRSTRTTSGDDAPQAPGAEAGEPQGIWGRFRSARKPRSTTSS
jgi:uncharacterized LabA/DUF88 family protein